MRLFLDESQSYKEIGFGDTIEFLMSYRENSAELESFCCVIYVEIMFNARSTNRNEQLKGKSFQVIFLH